MGQRQSRKSVDITPTPKKNAAPVDGAAEGVPEKSPSESVDRKYEKIEDPDTKPASNGLVPHAESTEDKDKDEATEKPQEAKAEETKVESSGEAPTETAEVTTPTETTTTSSAAASPVTSPESKEPKKKEKVKKKWSIRSISFSKKDKSKPPREDAKNGDVAKEKTLVEATEETAPAATAASESSSPVEEKSAVSSPSTTEAEAVAATEAKEEEPSPVVQAESKPEQKEDEAEEKKLEPAAAAPAVEKVEKTTPKEDEKPMNKVVENGTSDVPETVVQSLPPPPAVDSPTPAPAITEDVASVTKAIEEIDISDKAVAAAVNAAIDGTNATELVADRNE